jgi:hypothetical protein
MTSFFLGIEIVRLRATRHNSTGIVLERLAVGKAGAERRHQVLAKEAKRVSVLCRTQVLFIDGDYSVLQATQVGIDRHLTS